MNPNGPASGSVSAAKHSMSDIKAYTQEEWDEEFHSGSLSNDDISSVLGSPMNRHLVTGVELAPVGKQQLSPSPKPRALLTEPDPTKAIHTNAQLLQETGDRDDAESKAEAPCPAPPPPPVADSSKHVATPETATSHANYGKFVPSAVQTRQGIKLLPHPQAQPPRMAPPLELVTVREELGGLHDITKLMEFFPPLPYQPGGKLPDM